MYQDIVSISTIKAQNHLVLQAQITTNIGSHSNTAEDQFSIFAADDITRFKGNEFGFVLPETGSCWYAYVQSPQIKGFFVWSPILNIEPNTTELHDFKAIYSDKGIFSDVCFFVDGELKWSSVYPTVSGDFHLVLTAHKVSPQTVDISLNQMQVKKPILSNLDLGDVLYPI
jgi:hypothetical protein